MGLALAWGMKTRLLLTLAVFFLVAATGFAKTSAKTTYGPEFNFWSEKMRAENRLFQGYQIGRPETFKAQKQLVDRISELCNECSLEEIENGHHSYKIFRFHHPEGWNFTISIDPGVVEVQMSPQTSVEISSRREKIQEYIFKAASDVGLDSTSNMGCRDIFTLA